MRLTLVQLDRPVGVKLWFPFSYEEAGVGFNDRWWYNRPIYPSDTGVFLRVVENDSEVARIHLIDDEVDIDHYADVPSVGASALKIHLLEVRNGHRGRGIGRTAVPLLRKHYPDRRLMAFSEGADGFWSSLGWRRHLCSDPEMVSSYQPLFIQPLV
ncbi:hypothetical protein KBX03_02940 [Micromonospora sp. C72]|uniref:hypothetical protein n=1 Tax=Micromonospora sp. C72 TaxID=2824880 RepID=UPI001B3813D7|nr:hypothetical protein [Micromonospora sp. C72]MBQ1041456.1 hypothetical protein [Micromonospora sp. C72]